MNKYCYKKISKNNLKKNLRLTGGLLLVIGISIFLYSLLPILSWKIYLEPVYASQDILLPVPHASVVDLTRNLVDSTDYTKVENWFKDYSPKEKSEDNLTSYTISIPEIKIENAIVSTVNTNLENNLVNYRGTSIPGKNGNAVIFGHSTLPQLFDPKNYKTIFANIHKLKNDDIIYVTINGTTYAYRIFKAIVVDSGDSSALTQNYDNSYLTLVTCTPPGTIWKRLVVMAKLEKI
jgi:sortase A